MQSQQLDKRTVSETFSLINSTKATLPEWPFVQMKNAVLGEQYELSVAIVSEKKIHELNLVHREKDSPTDILSFPLDEQNGEIYLNLDYTKKKAREFGQTYENYLGYLFIHGLLHLNGFDHGSTMESEEAKYCKAFGISHPWLATSKSASISAPTKSK